MEALHHPKDFNNVSHKVRHSAKLIDFVISDDFIGNCKLFGLQCESTKQGDNGTLNS